MSSLKMCAFLFSIALAGCALLMLDACVGPAGPAGEVGERGERGERGAMGLRGERGPGGKMGVRGERGDVGATGAQGERGPQGQTGPGPVPIATTTCDIATHETHPTVGAMRASYRVTEFAGGMVITKCEVTRRNPRGTTSNTFLWLPDQRDAKAATCKLSGPLGDWVFRVDKDSGHMASYIPDPSFLDGGMPVNHVLLFSGSPCTTFPGPAFPDPNAEMVGNRRPQSF